MGSEMLHLGKKTSAAPMRNSKFQVRNLTVLMSAFLWTAQSLCGQSSSSTSPNSASTNENQDATAESQVEPLIIHPVPYPYVFIGPMLTGGAYRPLTLLAEAGLEIETRYGFANASAAYDNDRMTNEWRSAEPQGARSLPRRQHLLSPSGSVIPEEVVCWGRLSLEPAFDHELHQD